MTWHRLSSGPNAGKTLPEVFFEDPDYVLGGLEAGEFDGAMLAEAVEIRSRASRIRIPDHEGEGHLVVFYHLLPDRSFGGFSIVAQSDPKLVDFKRFAVGSSQGFDLTMPRRIAPADPRATRMMLGGVLFQYFGTPHTKLTAKECVAFFEDDQNFAACISKGGRR